MLFFCSNSSFSVTSQPRRSQQMERTQSFFVYNFKNKQMKKSMYKVKVELLDCCSNKKQNNYFIIFQFLFSVEKIPLKLGKQPKAFDLFSCSAWCSYHFLSFTSLVLYNRWYLFPLGFLDGWWAIECKRSAYLWIHEMQNCI